MKIIRILNNNVVQALRFNKEVMVQGKGIGFKVRPGDTVDESKIQKIYELENDKASDYLFELASIIPESYWDFTLKIQRFVEKSLNKNLTYNFYASMLDHIYMAVLREKKKIKIPTFSADDIKIFYPELYKISSNIVDEMRNYFKVDFDDNEIGFIAIHIVDTIIDDYSEGVYDTIMDIIHISEQIVKTQFKIIYKDNIHYSRFMNHLKYFAEKVVSNKYEKSNDNFSNVFDELGSDFDKQKECLNEICKVIEEKYNYQISVNDKFYLLIHLIKITNR